MKVACVLITHLPMKAELGRHLELQGRPAIITRHHRAGGSSKRLVLDSSPEARGISCGMPLQEALSRRKDTVLLEADEPYYQSVFDVVLRSLEQRSPLVEKAGLGYAYVGLDGLEAMYGGEARLITALLQAVPQALNPRIGVAAGKFPAYVAAVTSSRGQSTRVPEDVARFLKDFSVDLLPLPWEAVDRLHRFGLHTLGQLAALPPGSVQAQLGVEGRRAWELSNGIDPSPLLPYQREEVVSESLTFPSPTVTLDAILTGLEILLSRAFARPALRGRYIRSVVIESRVIGHAPWTRRFAFKEAVSGKERAFFVLKSVVEGYCNTLLPGPLEDMALTLAGLTGESGIQTSLFSDVRRREQLREMMRQLEVRLGAKPPIYQVRDVEPWSRIPERRQALVPFDP
jgi:nucleotidyltransferase/DNA polymerase involved in DNA repair